MSATLIVARETWKRVSASRTTVGFAIVFSALALALSYFGLSGNRAVGFQGFSRVTASLANLVVYVVPLCALIVGTTEITGRPKSLAIVLAQPVRRRDVLLGSFLGVAAALGTALLIGLGGAGVLIALQAGSASAVGYLVLVGASLVMLLAYLAIAYFLGVTLLDRLRATGAALLVWFGTVIVYDLALIGLSALFRGLPLKSILVPAILLNPVDITRVLTTLASGRGALFGPAGASLVETFGTTGGAAVALAAFALQITLPLALALWIFRRRDL